MNFSILPIYIVLLFAFYFFLVRRANKTGLIDAGQVRAVHLLLGSLMIWSVVAAVMGLMGVHASRELLEGYPVIWQARVPVVILAIYLLVSGNARQGLKGTMRATPLSWAVFFQGLRVGALGGVLKGVTGKIDSSFVYYVGLPDMAYGVSALMLGYFVLKGIAGTRVLFFWNLLGAAVILGPVFVLNDHFMSEPGIVFLFEFPMVLAPSIVVPLFVIFNLLQARHCFGLWRQVARRPKLSFRGEVS